MRNLKPSNKKSVIYECDYFALCCYFWLWGDVITDAVVIYTDNNGVRDTWIFLWHSKLYRKEDPYSNAGT